MQGNTLAPRMQANSSLRRRQELITTLANSKVTSTRTFAVINFNNDVEIYGLWHHRPAVGQLRASTHGYQVLVRFGRTRKTPTTFSVSAGIEERVKEQEKTHLGSQQNFEEPGCLSKPAGTQVHRTSNCLSALLRSRWSRG